MLRCCCIGSVLLMQLFLWNWAFPLPRQRLWFISNLHPGVPSSSFPPETFLLLAIWFQLLWRPYTMQLSHAWQSKEGPQKGEAHLSPALGWWWGIRIPAVQCDLRQEHPTILLFSLSLQLLGACIPANSCPRLAFHSPCLWQGHLAFAMPSAATAHPPLLSLSLSCLCHLSSPARVILPSAL